MSVRLAGALLALLLAAPAAAVPAGFAIQAFDVDLDVGADATLAVRETLTVAFAGAHRGLVRTIPLVAPGRPPIWIDDVHALDDAHRPLRTEVTRTARAVTIRAWVPDAVDATRTVRFLYRVRGALTARGGRDELRWNAIGNDWPVPIARARVVLSLPPGVAPSSVLARAYTGPRGDAGAEWALEPGNRLAIWTTGALAAGEGLTVAVGWPSGAVAHPPAWRRAWWDAVDHWPLGLPLLTLLAAVLVWRAWGRDPALNRSIMPEYAPPPGLTPAEAGALADTRVEPREIIATLIDLGVRGYLHIEPTGDGDFSLRRTRELHGDPGLAPIEVEILKRVFGEGLSLRERFLSELRRDQDCVFPPLRDAIYRAMVADGLFPASPYWIRQGWTLAGAAALFAAGLLFVQAERLDAGLAWPAGVGGSALVILGLSRVMPRRTLRGARLLVRVRGFQEFLERAEKDQLRRLPPDTLHRWLPWAIALGVTHEWIERFEDLPVAEPDWYTGWGPFTLGGYEQALLRFGTRAIDSLRAGGGAGAPGAIPAFSGSGRGGFGGGGSGGGGGGTF